MNYGFCALALLGAMMADASCAQSTSPAEGRLYSPGSFERLEVSGNAVVKLLQGERDVVLVQGNEAAQRSVELVLNGDQLQVRPVGEWKFWTRERPHIEVTMRKLTQLVLSGACELQAPEPLRVHRLWISVSGAGSVQLDELTADHLGFSISGAGEGVVRGQASELSLQVAGKGRLDAEQLQTQRAQVAISGIGEARVWAIEQLRVSVAGFGSVDYWGSPQVRFSRAGFASLTAHGDKR